MPSLSSIAATALAVAALASAQLGNILAASDWPGAGSVTSPDYPWLYQFPMPIPPAAQPLVSKTIGGVPVQFYSFNIIKFSKNIYPNLGNATLTGYNGTSPGPSVRIQRNTRTICRFSNYGDLSASVHLHGSATRSPWDGWASNTMQPGQFKDYFYPNTQSARPLWYHDHANGHTSIDAYYGQNGVYTIYDPAEDYLNLPTGNYDVPIMLIDKIYDSNGELVSPAGDTVNFFGDVIHANGQPWPYFTVEPRKYRFRMLNSALSRPFQIYLSQDSTGKTISYQVIGSDGGLLSNPVTTVQLDIGMGERYEIVIDFASYSGQNITMMNSLDLDGVIDYANTDKILRFVVTKNITSLANNNVPSTLNSISYPPSRSAIDHIFNFEHNAVNWTINGVVFDDVKARVLARPPEGTVETWQLNYLSGPGVHPIHVHLVDFKVVSRVGGRGEVLPYESAGLKDVVLMAPGESIIVTAIYGPWNGLYQFHCHNLIHEDHEMMDVFNVTASPILEKLGYTNLLSFDDPMDPRFLPQNINSAYYDLGYISNTLLPKYIALNAYGQQTKVAAILSSYYMTASYGESATLKTTSSSSTQTWRTHVTQPHYTYSATFKALVAVAAETSTAATATSTSVLTSSTTTKTTKSKTKTKTKTKTTTTSASTATTTAESLTSTPTTTAESSTSTPTTTAQTSTSTPTTTAAAKREVAAAPKELVDAARMRGKRRWWDV